MAATRRKSRRKTKLVRVDAKTIIEIDARKSSVKAVEEYLEKTGRNRPNYLYRRKKHN